MATDAPEQLICPECKKDGVEKAFSTNQALGAHRNRAHGVPGRGSKKEAATPQKQPRAVKQRQRRNGHDLDRNKLLGLVFPEGIPAKAEIISEIETWLKDADRLAHAK